ncbi:MAG: hypothetical protein ABIC82_05070, partial [bacterium]
FAQTNPKKVNKIKWSIACGFVSGHGRCADIKYAIDEKSGEINISVNESAVMYDVFSITVTATSDLNSAISHSENFNIKVSDKRCGNGTVEPGEECDDGLVDINNVVSMDGCEPTDCKWSVFSITSTPPKDYLVAEQDVFDYTITTNLIPPASASLDYTISGAPADLVIDNSDTTNPKIISNGPNKFISNAQAGFYKITIQADYKDPKIPNSAVSSATQKFNLIIVPRYDLAGSFDACTADGRCTIDSLSTTDDELKLSTSYGTKYLWLADANNSIIYQISAGTENGAPESAGTVVRTIDVSSVCLSPSRTTIDFDGYVWIGCRLYTDTVETDVIRINPNNGQIKDTFDIDVKCGARGVVVDKNNSIWVGCRDTTRIFHLVDNGTGYVIKTDDTIDTGVKIYGMALDKDGYVWISAYNNAPQKGYVINLANPSKSASVDLANTYGIAVDNNNHAWVAGWGSQKVYEITKSVDAFGDISLISEDHQTPVGYNTQRGMAIAPDPDNVGEMNIWTTFDQQNAVGLFDKDGVSLGVTSVSGATPIGITSTNDGTVWAINFSGADTIVNGVVNPTIDINRFKQIPVCVSPAINCIKKVAEYNVMTSPTGAFYSYSDMAGFSLLNIVGATKGVWTLYFDGMLFAPTWTTITWSGENSPTFWGNTIPTGDTSITFKVKSANTKTDLASTDWGVTATNGTAGTYADQVINISEVSPRRWLEVQIEFDSPSSITTPILKDIQIDFTQ